VKKKFSPLAMSSSSSPYGFCCCRHVVVPDKLAPGRRIVATGVIAVLRCSVGVDGDLVLDTVVVIVVVGVAVVVVVVVVLAVISVVVVVETIDLVAPAMPPSAGTVQFLPCHDQPSPLHWQ